MKIRFFLWSLMAALTLMNVPGVFAEAIQQEETLTDVFVTATRTEQDFGKLGGSSVSMMEYEEIDGKKQFNVGEVLKGIPGLDVISNGGMGTITHVFMRGADSKNTLLLIDGMMFNDPSSPNRAANIENITTDAIERIEVVRGPMSVLYGSNATAGVINIITKKGTEKPSVFAGVEGGSYNTWKYNAGILGTVNDFNFSLLGSLLDTEGFSIADDHNDRIPHEGNTDEEDGWNNKNLYGKFGADIHPDFDITANFMLLDTAVDLDDWGPGYAGDRFVPDEESWWIFNPDPNGLKEFETTSHHAGGKINVHNYFFNQGCESLLSFQTFKHAARDYDNNGEKTAKTEGKTHEWSWQGGFDIQNMHQLDFGATHFTEKMDQDSTWSSIPETSAITRSVWIQDQFYMTDYLGIVGGVRMDDHEKFGGKATYRLAPACYFSSTTLKAALGTGFRSPSLYELFSDSGNEDLDPEKSLGWDVGVEQSFLNQSVQTGLTYFNTVYEDRIGWDPDLITPQTPWGAYNQLDGETKTSGIEAFFTYQVLSDLTLSMDYTYTDTEDPDGNRLVRRPYNKIHLNSQYAFLEKGRVNLDAYWVGERDEITSAMDENGNRVEYLDDYLLVNVAVNYDITSHMNVHTRLDNLFDEFYEDAWSYASPGRSAYVGLKVTY
jgi:vitamin B12 transporter